MTDEKVISRPDLKEVIKQEPCQPSILVLHNDDYNTFEHVIRCLIEVCEHEPEQAQQCAMLTHYKGRCDVKYDIYERLEPKKHALQGHGLCCTIEDSYS